jgi:Raf kinase inhibitor-like YbhB/YbcL family protein
MMIASRAPLPFDYMPSIPRFDVESDDLIDGGLLQNVNVGNIMGYEGGNRSPQLRWTGYPPETRSFAVTMFDPDAPTGSGFWHWVVFNIPAAVNELVQGAGAGHDSGLPEGAVQTQNDLGLKGYIGAAPPPGDSAHRYVIAVHAVDTEQLDADVNSTPAIVGFNLRYHSIARAVVIPVFGS